MATKRKVIRNPYLWHVDVEYNKFTGSRGTTTLRVTTPHQSIDSAIAKARAHIKKDKYDWPKSKITGAELQGQIVV